MNENQTTTRLEGTKRPAGAKAQVPLFVVTGTEASLVALGYFLNELPAFANLVTGWKDKNKREGIMLVDSGNQRVAVLICHTLEARDTAVAIIQTHLGIES